MVGKPYGTFERYLRTVRHLTMAYFGSQLMLTLSDIDAYLMTSDSI